MFQMLGAQVDSVRELDPTCQQQRVCMPHLKVLCTAKYINNNFLKKRVSLVPQW